MAQDFSFRFTTPTSNGWTAASLTRNTSTAPTAQPSVVGGVNGLAQNPITAANLRTTPSTLVDTSLGSRRYVNPNTGVRDPVLSGSVYGMGDVPAYLTQAVSDLNAEQALRRSIQAEWNNRLITGAQNAGDDAYLWQEAIRAASVTPGAAVTFGQAIQNPLIGRGYNATAQAQAKLDTQRAQSLADAAAIQAEIQRLSAGSPVNLNGFGAASQIGSSTNAARLAALQDRLAAISPIATASAGAGGNVNAPRPGAMSPYPNYATGSPSSGPSAIRPAGGVNSWVGGYTPAYSSFSYSQPPAYFGGF